MIEELKRLNDIHDGAVQIKTAIYSAIATYRKENPETIIQCGTFSNEAVINIRFDVVMPETTADRIVSINSERKVVRAFEWLSEEAGTIFGCF